MSGTTLATFDDINIDTTYFFLICFQCTDLIVGSGNSQSHRWMAKPHSFESILRRRFFMETFQEMVVDVDIGVMAFEGVSCFCYVLFFSASGCISSDNWTYHGFSYVRSGRITYHRLQVKEGRTNGMGEDVSNGDRDMAFQKQ